MFRSSKVCLLPDIYPTITVFNRFLDVYRVHSRFIFFFRLVIITRLHSIVVLFLEIPSENFLHTGVPAGYEVQWITEVLEVELRGPRNLISEITPEDITAVLDFSDEEPGNVMKAPKLTLSSKYSSLGAISNNSITALLREATIGTEG